MTSIAIFGGGPCARSHIHSLARVKSSKDFNIKVYTNNSQFSKDLILDQFSSLNVYSPKEFSTEQSQDIVLIANKSADHVKTWVLAHNELSESLIVVEKPFAASLVPQATNVNFVDSKSYVLFQKRVLFMENIKNTQTSFSYPSASHNNLIQLKAKLVKRSFDLDALKRRYAGLSLNHMILIHFCIHELDLVEFCTNSKIVNLQTKLSVVCLDKPFISIEGEVNGNLQCGHEFSITYSNSYNKLPQIVSLATSKDSGTVVHKKELRKKNYSEMTEIRDCFWQQVIDGSRRPLRRLTSCISLENLLIK